MSYAMEIGMSIPTRSFRLMGRALVISNSVSEAGRQ